MCICVLCVCVCVCMFVCVHMCAHVCACACVRVPRTFVPLVMCVRGHVCAVRLLFVAHACVSEYVKLRILQYMRNIVCIGS